MAHTCPRCGQYCDCRGDWDDLDFGVDWNCECECEGWGSDDDTQEDDYLEEWPYGERDRDQEAEDKSPNDSRNL